MIDTMQAIQKAAVEAVIAITAVHNEVLKTSGSTEKDCADGKKFLTSQYSPRGIPVNAFHAVKSVITAEAIYSIAAVKIIVNVLKFFFLKNTSGEDGKRCRASKNGRCIPVGRSNFITFFSRMRI